ncbi:MAG: alpha/beta fold hydrolase, partial [Gammaproteobacteria bacterium]|nr:alpha/beta fold hydrolase [Gammaproteobacteria bacterium]
MQNLKVEFENDEGQKLAGILDLPATNVRAYALFAHCFTCSKNLKAATNISRAMTAAGIGVLRFDFTGLGQSEGDFAATNFSSNVRDLLAAAAFLAANYAAPAILLGHSLGGTAVLQAAASLSSAVAVATIGSPSEPAHVAHMFGDARDELDEKGYAEVTLGGRPFTVRQQFLDDLRQHNLPVAIGSLRKALLIMHAPLDAVVEIDNAGALFAAAKHPKSFVSLDKADHLLSSNEDSLYAGRVLAAWASRYLPTLVPPTELAAGSGEVIARTFTDGFRTDVRAGKHALLADEPVAVGGTDLGPTPYDLLSAALATCTTMTLKMYASHKKLNLRSTTVRVSHGKVHAEDCVDCESKEGRIDQF